MSLTLTVTSKGQLTLRKEVLEHLGAHPGDRLQVHMLANGGLQLRAQPKQRISSVFGLLARPGTKPLSIEDMGDITRQSWSRS